MSKKNNFKYLSQSVLLEEKGLPRINKLIIIVIFSMLIGFLMWANYMQMDEILSVKGYVIAKENSNINFSFIAKIPSKEILNIDEGLSSNISIPALSDNGNIDGTISYVDGKLKIDEQGFSYYTAIIVGEVDEKKIKYFNDNLIENMETQINIVIGSRNLIEYFLKPVLKTTQNAFKER